MNGKSVKIITGTTFVIFTEKVTSYYKTGKQFRIISTKEYSLEV